MLLFFQAVGRQLRGEFLITQVRIVEQVHHFDKKYCFQVCNYTFISRSRASVRGLSKQKQTYVSDLARSHVVSFTFSNLMQRHSPAKSSRSQTLEELETASLTPNRFAQKQCHRFRRSFLCVCVSRGHSLLADGVRLTLSEQIRYWILVSKQMVARGIKIIERVIHAQVLLCILMDFFVNCADWRQ